MDEFEDKMARLLNNKVSAVWATIDDIKNNVPALKFNPEKVSRRVEILEN